MAPARTRMRMRTGAGAGRPAPNVTGLTLAGLLGVAALAAVVLTLALGSQSPTHVLLAGFANTNQMTPGQEVRIAGRRVGEITHIALDRGTGTAVATLQISDPQVWPLPQGSIAVARWGSNTSYLGRYTEIIPGPARNPPLRDGGILTPQQDQSAFELDQAYNIFRGPTAAQTQALLNRLGATLSTQGPALQRGLGAAPVGFDQAAGLLSSLSTNEYDLRLLASSGDATLSALNSRSPELQQLVSSAAGTFRTFAAHTGAEQQALAQARPSLLGAEHTFGRLDGSLSTLTALVHALAPGAPRLARLATSATSALTTLRAVAPQATATLSAGTAAAPRLASLFTAGNAVFPSASRALSTSAPMLACLRPYTPDIAGFLTTWSGFTSHYDAGGHYGRSFELTVVPALLPGTGNSPAKAIAQSPNITYAFPRPPGLNEGRPYFIPQCGVTPAALNPADDPEAAR